jgi:hypothetical protein
MVDDADGAVAVAIRDESAGDEPAPRSGPATWPGDRWALVALLTIAVASIALLLRLGHDRWFAFDDWDFLASRDAGNLRELFEPHGPHWSTLPILVYRVEWYLFGLHSYWPYQLVCVLSHLTVVLLIRRVMRRAGVRPWTATAAVLPLVFFGAGEENIAYAFQINFNASLAFGLIHLLLADHDGPVDWRDWLALLAGFAGLMSSGIAVTMVVVVGLAMLVRRGWRVALLHTAPLGVAYVVWYAAIARDAYDGQDVSDPIDALAFARTTIAAGFGGLAQVPGLGWVLGGLIIGGLALAWRGKPTNRLRQVAAAPAALAAGALVFVLITAFGRVGFAPGIERSTRYTYVVGALLLPMVAVAVDAVVRRWRAAVPVFLVALMASLFGNIQDFSNDRAYSGEFLANYRIMMLTFPRTAFADQVPRDLRPERGLAPYVSIGWLLNGVESGRIPPPGDVEPRSWAAAEARVALQQRPDHRPVECETVVGPADTTLRQGSSIRTPGAGQFWVTYTDSAGVGGLVPFRAGNVPVVAYGGPLKVKVAPTAPDQPVDLCDLDGGPTTTLPSGP